jgi:hypothetical protein
MFHLGGIFLKNHIGGTDPRHPFQGFLNMLDAMIAGHPVNFQRCFHGTLLHLIYSKISYNFDGLNPPCPWEILGIYPKNL